MLANKQRRWWRGRKVYIPLFGGTWRCAVDTTDSEYLLNSTSMYLTISGVIGTKKFLRSCQARAIINTGVLLQMPCSCTKAFALNTF
jgi:hypothetical protein